MLFLLSLSIASCGLSTYSHYSFATKYHVLREEGEIFDKGDISLIDLDWIDGKIVFDTTEEFEYITIFEETKETYDEDYLCHLWRNSDVLNIKYAASGVSIPQKVEKALKVLIPTSYTLENLKLYSVSSFIEIHNVSINNIEINNVSGNVIINRCNVESLEYYGVSGNLKMRVPEIAKDIKIDQVSGSTLISIPDDTLGFEVDFYSVSGDVNLDFDVKIHNGSYIYGDPDNLSIEVDTVSGNLSVVRYIKNENATNR